MPKREEKAKDGVAATQDNQQKKTAKTALFKKAEDLFKKAGLLEDVAEMEERVVQVDNGTVNIVAATFHTGKEAIKEIVWEFMTDDTKQFEGYFIEIMKEDKVLTFYRDQQ